MTKLLTTILRMPLNSLVLTEEAELAGFILTSDLIISDVIDEDEVNTGTRREGMFFGLNAFITRFALGLQAVSMSVVFIMSGYTPYIYTQPKSFQEGLRLLLAGCPIVALFFAICFMLFYPLAGKRLDELKKKIAAMRV